MPLCVVGYGHLSLASVVAEHPNVDAELLYAAAEQYFPEAVSLLYISSLRFVSRPLHFCYRTLSGSGSVGGWISIAM